jgi:hypothetical protein
MKPSQSYMPNLEGVVLPYEMIHDAITNNWHTSLIYFIQLRQKHVNKIFYNHSQRSVADKIGISAPTLAHHVRILTKLRLIETRLQQNGKEQLCLRGHKFFRENWKGKPTFIKYGTKNEIKTLLESIPIIRNIKSQECALARKIDRNLKKHGISESIKNFVCLPDNLVAKIFGCGISKARRIKHNLANASIIELNPVWQSLSRGMSKLEFLHLRELGAIPCYAKYISKSKAIVVRRADAVAVISPNGNARRPFSSWDNIICNKPNPSPVL